MYAYLSEVARMPLVKEDAFMVSLPLILCEGDITILKKKKNLCEGVMTKHEVKKKRSETWPHIFMVIKSCR